MSKLKISGQEGRALVLTLIALAIGCLLIPPFLSYISTNLLASRATEKGMKGLYAADAGVEYAIRRIKDGECPEGTPFDTPTLVNGMPVTVTVGTESEGVYKVITSTATNVVDGSSTTIVSYVSLNTLDFAWLFDSAITSPGDVTLKPGTVITGNVTYGGSITGEENITEPYSATLDSSLQAKWPTAEELSALYHKDVEGCDYLENTIDLKDTSSIGPMYRDGNLDIISSEENATAVLSGTVHVTGDLDVGKTNKDFTLDLNGQTIFVEGTIDVGGKCTISGSGCIIAIGDIFFLPKIESSPDDFLFIMSLDGTSTIQPDGDLCGAVAGDTEVELKPGCSLTWGGLTGGADELNFPAGSSGTFKIHTYNINP